MNYWERIKQYVGKHATLSGSNGYYYLTINEHPKDNKDILAGIEEDHIVFQMQGGHIKYIPIERISELQVLAL